MKLTKPIIVLAGVVLVLVIAAAIVSRRQPGKTETSGIRIVDMQYGQSDRSRSISAAMGMIQANEKLDGFFGSNESSAFGILRALEQRNLAGKVKFVGFDASEDLVQGLRQKHVDALVVQDPFNIGFEAVHQMILHLQGKPVPKTFYTQLKLITLENLQTPEIQALINPPLDKYLNAPAKANAKWRLAVVPKGTAHIFWQTVHAGAIAAGQEFDAEITWKGTEDESKHAEQANIVEGFITAGVHGIVLGPTQADSQVPVIEKAVAKGIPVVIFDSGANTDKYVSFVATDNYKGGVLAAKELYRLIGGKGNVAIVATMPGGASTTERERGFLQTMAKDYGVTSAETFLKTIGAKPEKK